MDRDDESVRQRAWRCGASYLLQKPFDPERLGEYRYRVRPAFLSPTRHIGWGEAQEVGLELRRETYPDVLNVAFARGFVSSQAFVERLVGVFLASLVVFALLLVANGADPIAGYRAMWSSITRDTTAFGDVTVKRSTPDDSVPGARQNSELVVAKASMTTSHLRLERAWSTWLESGPMLVAVIPDRTRPDTTPRRISPLANIIAVRRTMPP